METGGIIILCIGACGLLFFILLLKSLVKEGGATTIFSRGFSWSWKGDGKK